MLKLNKKSREAEQFQELLVIIRKILSEKDGCIRAKQDVFENHLKQILSEINELDEAIKHNSVEEINEELGHVLFDVLYLALLGEKSGKANLENVLKELNWSMKFRHPHVFEGVKADTIEDIKKLMKERKDTYHKMKKNKSLKLL